MKDVNSLKSTGRGLVNDLKQTVDNIIEFLKQVRPKSGTGISVNETPYGCIINCTKQSQSASQQITQAQQRRI